MLLAAIDIGTNAIRLLVSNVFDQNGLVIAEKASLVRIPVRLGEDVFARGEISEEKIQKLIKTLNAFQLLLEVYQPKAYRAVATSAMREASNGQLVVDQVSRQTGINIEIIDGKDEADLVSKVNTLKLARKNKLVMFVDVGGGSTEISVLENGNVKQAVSFKIGTVRLLNNKVEEGEWNSLEKWLKPYQNESQDLLLVGSGGNINKINKLYGRLAESILPAENLDYALKHLAFFSVQQRVELMGLRPDRADVIIPAAEIFQFILKQTGSTKIYVPKIGLSDGIVTSLYHQLSTAN